MDIHHNWSRFLFPTIHPDLDQKTSQITKSNNWEKVSVTPWFSPLLCLLTCAKYSRHQRIFPENMFSSAPCRCKGLVSPWMWCFNDVPSHPTRLTKLLEVVLVRKQTWQWSQVCENIFINKAHAKSRLLWHPKKQLCHAWGCSVLALLAFGLLFQYFPKPAFLVWCFSWPLMSCACSRK